MKNLKVAITDPKKQEAMVIADNDNFSLAIGKRGQNARLASRLTHYRIDIKNYNIEASYKLHLADKLQKYYGNKYEKLIEYAYKKRVWITSPTTLMSTLTTIQVIIKNAERDKYAKVIREELVKLSVEFSRYNSH